MLGYNNYLNIYRIERLKNKICFTYSILIIAIYFPGRYQVQLDSLLDTSNISHHPPWWVRNSAYFSWCSDYLQTTKNSESKITRICRVNIVEIEQGNRKFKNVILTFLAICLTWWFPFHQVITASGLEPELVHSISYVLNADKWALLFVIFTSNGFTGIRRVSLNRYQSKKVTFRIQKTIQF